MAYDRWGRRSVAQTRLPHGELSTTPIGTRTATITTQCVVRNRLREHEGAADVRPEPEARPRYRSQSVGSAKLLCVE